jgi:hypothetical protein
MLGVVVFVVNVGHYNRFISAMTYSGPRSMISKLFRVLLLVGLLLMGASLATKLDGQLISLPEPLAALVNWLNETVDNIKRSPTAPAEAFDELLDIAANPLPRVGEQHHVADWLCRKPATRAIDEVDKKAIYQWRDEKGRPQFSDQAPKHTAATNVADQYLSGQQYFRFKLDNRGGPLPVYFADTVKVGTRKAYDLLKQSFSAEQLRQVDLNLVYFDRRDAYLAYQQKQAPSLGNNTAGFYTMHNNQAVVMAQHSAEATHEVALHEAIHVITAGMFGPTPRWLAEGLAEYFEAMEVSGQLVEIKPDRRALTALQKSLAAGQLPSLQQLSQMGNEQWRSEQITLRYQQSWSLIYFLMENAHRRERFMQFLQQLQRHSCQPFNSFAALSEHYGSAHGLQRDWQQWLQAGRWRTHRY